jgi:glycosyltransferase involved in cell wall biosynthesis
MKVSVVMAAYNAERYIGKAIESILNQTYTDFEFIIVNDGSKDGTEKILAGFNDPRIHIISQPNAGLSKSLNRGIKTAKGEYIARFDADDICYPSRLAKQVDFLTKNKDVALAGSNANIITEEGEFLYTSKLIAELKTKEDLLKSVPFFHSSVMFRKSAFEKTGGYREDIIHHFEDKLLWGKMIEHGRMVNLDEPLIEYRLNPTSISNKNKSLYQLQKTISNSYLNEIEVAADLYRNFVEKSNLPLAERQINYYYNVSKIFLIQRGDRQKFFKYIKLALRLSPSNLKTLKLLCYSFFCKTKQLK